MYYFFIIYLKIIITNYKYIFLRRALYKISNLYQWKENLYWLTDVLNQNVITSVCMVYEYWRSARVGIVQCLRCLNVIIQHTHTYTIQESTKLYVHSRTKAIDIRVSFVFYFLFCVYNMRTTHNKRKMFINMLQQAVLMLLKYFIIIIL